MYGQEIVKQIVVVILVMVFLVGCGSNAPTSVAEVATDIPATATDIPATDTPVPPTDTPVPPTDTPVPPTFTPTPAPPKMGDDVTVGDMTIKVRSIEQVSPSSIRPDTGMIYLGVKLDITNSGSAEQAIEQDFTGLVFYDGLETALHPNADAVASFEAEYLLPETIPAGETAKGYLGYTIPIEATNLEFRFIYTGTDGTEAIPLDKSTKKIITDRNRIVNNKRALGEMCEKLVDSSPSAESTTGGIRFMAVSDLGSERYNDVTLENVGYVKSNTDTIGTLVCLFYDREVVETCEYTTNTSTIPITQDRATININAVLINFETEEVVKQEYFPGGYPDLCPDTVEINENSYTLPSITGDIVTEEEIFEWAKESWTP